MSAGSGHKTNKSSSRLKSRTMQVFTCKHEVFALSVTIVSPVKPYSALLVTPHCALCRKDMCRKDSACLCVGSASSESMGQGQGVGSPVRCCAQDGC